MGVKTRGKCRNSEIGKLLSSIKNNRLSIRKIACIETKSTRKLQIKNGPEVDSLWKTSTNE